MNFYVQKEFINFKGRTVVVEVIYDKDQEYLPRVSISGSENARRGRFDIEACVELRKFSDIWVDRGFWRDLEFKEFAEKIFGDR